VSLSTRCPSCQSLDVVANGDQAGSSSWTCRNCGARFRFEAERTVLEARPGSASGRWWAIGALLVVGGAGAWWATRAPDTAPATPVEPAPSKPAGPALGEGTPAAEIADLREGTTSLGGRYWLMTYKNTGTAVIDRPSVLVKLTDAAGKPVGEETGQGTRDQLAPGESMPCFVLKNDAPKGARAEVVPAPPQVATREPWKQALQVEGLAHKKQMLGATSVVGEVIHTGKGNARFIEVIVVGVDAAGHPVSWGSGMPMTEALPSGGRSPFQVRMGTFEVEAPVDYKGFALGNVK
jgi:hypothetical protein